MFGPQERHSAAKKLIPPNRCLGLDEIMEYCRIGGWRQIGACHPVFEAGNEDIQDDIMVFRAVHTYSCELAEGSNCPLSPGWDGALEEVINGFEVGMAPGTLR
jgi:hypothetical protein